MKIHPSAVGVLVLTLGASPASAQNDYYWDGSQNNNWDNGPNWTGPSGWPNSSNDNAIFDYNYVGANDLDVDLRGGTFDVRNLDLVNMTDDMVFRSSTSANGTLRVYGDILFDRQLIVPAAGKHTFDINLDIEGDCLWRAGRVHYLEINGQLGGSGDITTEVTYAPAIGREIAALYGENTYSGHLTINDGYFDIRNRLALQNARVTVNYDSGLYLAWLLNQTFPIGPIGGTGKIDLDGVQLVTTSTINTTLSGDLVSAVSATAKKLGSGSWTLAGAVHSPSLVWNAGTGDTNLNGGGMIGNAEVNAGSLNFGGGDLAITGSGTNVLYAHSGGIARVRTGAHVTLTSTSGTNRVVVTNNSALAVTGAGSLLTTPRIDVGPSGAGTAVAYAQSDGSIAADRIRVGDVGSDDGASAEFSVFSGATVNAGDLFLYRRGSLNVLGGSLTADRIVEGDGVTATHSIMLSDPAGGPALTIGGNGGSSVIESVIADGGPTPGSIRKVGAGTLELTGDNTFAGNTTVDGGTLLLSNTTGSATGSSDIEVNDGGTLTGEGSAAGAVTIHDGGTLDPGDPVGRLDVGGLVMEPGSTLVVDIGGTANASHDLLVAPNNSASLGGTLVVTYSGAFVAAPGQSFLVLGSTGINGTFDSVVYPDDQHWTISYELLGVKVGICTDSDGDGVCDENDICPGSDDNIDTDGDGIPDGCDSCNAADIAEPFQVLDLQDINAFTSGFLGGDAIADLSGDGLFDLQDINLFIALFLAGCP
ncbi:MAG: autotransporter-associated beta strand repeat-containing protein [Phycisphaeraceae bacterium]|nr:MAG: autotransporter-associated beta strand repeat-containing protein [Phycisphaeraceae bacterium]